ncbi:MAG: cytidine deaminase [Oscillospiraceae bacterium]
MDDKFLIAEAFKARETSYSPYSGFMVGAALLCKDGKIFRGCNIENAAYSPTNCAERTAFFKAVCDGEREFEAIAIVGAPRGAAASEFGYAYPCGVCRQVMEEFCNPNTFQVLTARSIDEYLKCTLEELLPHGFGPENLGK